MRGSKLYRTVPIQGTYSYITIPTCGNSVKRGESPSVNLLEALEPGYEQRGPGFPAGSNKSSRGSGTTSLGQGGHCFLARANIIH